MKMILLAAWSLVDSLSAVHNGRAGQLSVRVPRNDTTIAIDGTLSAPPWRQASVLTGFSQYRPVDGAAAQDSTQVLVWYAKDAIYFGIRAFELHGSARATLANRDRIDGDDNVQLILTPFLRSHQAVVFAVNALGVQQDGTITEGVRTTVANIGLQNTTGPDSVDTSPDFVFESRGRLTSFGYQVEVRIPFRSIKFPARSPQEWGINILRKVQHSGHSDTWYPTKLAAASYLDQAGVLADLRDLDAGLVLDLNPIVTEKAIGNPSASSGQAWNYDVARPQFGGNVRWGITPNLLFNATYKPDFAEVEADATQLVFDPRVGLQYPEKRPFFLDGLEQFNTPNNLIYTRRVQAPIAASKLAGKVGDLSFAYLGALDDEGQTGLGAGHPTINVLRVRSDLAQGSQIGAVITDKEVGGSYKRLFGVDSRIRLGKIYSVNLQAATSVTREAGETSVGNLWQTTFTRTGRALTLNYRLQGIDPDFNAAVGFIPRVDIVKGVLDQRYTLYPKHSIVETLGLGIDYYDYWTYKNFTSFKAPRDREFQPYLAATLRGGWQVLYMLAVGSYGYDASIYRNTYLGHIGPSDTTYTPFVGNTHLSNVNHILQVTTPTFKHFDLSMFQFYGSDYNFFEWASADLWWTSMTLNYRPTDKVRAQLKYNAQVYWRRDDGSVVGRTLIPRLNLEYQLSRSVYFRVVGQYDGTYQDDLRDESRTGLPLFIANRASGTYTRAAAYQKNHLQMSALFSYKPMPGTVAFIGYGNELTEPDGFRFNQLRRVNDNLFVKFSYLFRM